MPVSLNCENDDCPRYEEWQVRTLDPLPKHPGAAVVYLDEIKCPECGSPGTVDVPAVAIVRSAGEQAG